MLFFGLRAGALGFLGFGLWGCGLLGLLGLPCGSVGSWGSRVCAVGLWALGFLGLGCGVAVGFGFPGSLRASHNGLQLWTLAGWRANIKGGKANSAPRSPLIPFYRRAQPGPRSPRWAARSATRVCTVGGTVATAGAKVASSTAPLPHLPIVVSNQLHGRHGGRHDRHGERHGSARRAARPPRWAARPFRRAAR